MEKPAASNLLQILPAFALRALAGFSEALERFVPDSCRADPDSTRRARLIAHFGVQGTIFGAIYAIFYGLIGHFEGAKVILVCSAVFAAVPYILRHTGNIGMTGHLVVGTMCAGFTQLTLIEGGIHCHAVAWLAAVPLCALLILGLRPAAIWSGVCFLVGTIIAVLTLSGVTLEPLYDPRWRDLIDAAGNLGIIIFLFILGLVFEVYRAEAFNRLSASMDELAASNEELVHLNNEKTEFLGIAAHDLRNPLTAIIGHADLLQIETRGEAASSGRQISKAGRRMLELITDLLDANAIEEGRYASQVEPQDLRALVFAGLQHHTSAAERKRSTVQLRDGEACWAQADRKAVLQVVDNLVSNALKYSPPGSLVLVSVEAVGEWVEFAVHDQGPGLSESDQAKLFQKHTRLSARPTAGESSVGLGLSIVKRLAEAMGGGVRCESKLGQGAIFILSLRAVPAELIPKGGKVLAEGSGVRGVEKIAPARPWSAAGEPETLF
ncbi:MAG TPA: HAMP domain-containing sensor histidine kinase [Chthoniobacter sp.]|nr:HAMP domain-containing sensor histidine kinase [Chthoniobacter sp.]